MKPDAGSTGLSAGGAGRASSYLVIERPCVALGSANPLNSLAICSGAGRSLRSSSGILDAGLSECSAVRMGHEKDGSARASHIAKHGTLEEGH